MNNNKEVLKATVGSSYSFAWDVIKERFIPLFLVLIILGIVGLPLGAMQNTDEIKAVEAILGVFVLAYTLFIMNPVKYGSHWVNLKAVRKLDFEIKEVFEPFQNYLNVVLAALLTSALIGIGIVFFIIPGIIIGCRLAFVPFLVMDKKLDPVKAVEESWRMTRGYGWKVFFLFLLAIPILILGLICLIFGVFISLMWIRAAYAALYQAVLEERGETAEPEIIDAVI
jgi:uncharacterized membrane protein